MRLSPSKLRRLATLFRAPRPPGAAGKGSSPVPFGNIPSAPGGAALVSPAETRSEMLPLLHGMMQASVVAQPGAVFLVGLDLEDVERFYPTAQRLAPTERVGRVFMTPSSAMTTLRVLLGADQLSHLLLELVYLEHAGNELSKTGPLVMIPEWVREQ